MATAIEWLRLGPARTLPASPAETGPDFADTQPCCRLALFEAAQEPAATRPPSHVCDMGRAGSPRPPRPSRDRCPAPAAM
ncbi:MAG TPA: hypothetical protein PLG77_09385, partial [Burkholderiaceae bacterium]|nr:hypothetical protein [Burkholderiaceae bacterium]